MQPELEKIFGNFKTLNILFFFNADQILFSDM